MATLKYITILVFVVVALTTSDPQKVLSENGKIAFLFLVRDHIPVEDLWREFFTFRTNPEQYSVHVHPRHGFKFPTTSFFHGREIPNTQNVKWGSTAVIKAVKNLVREALKDPRNEWFTHMSETCVPVHPFPVWRAAFMKQNKSIVNACNMGHGEMETETRWKPTLDQVRN
jgi:Core-2/I-Branching enzyme